MSWIDVFTSPAEIRPACPASNKIAGRLQSVAAVGLSSMSSTSSIKKCKRGGISAGHVFPIPGRPKPWPVLWHLVESFNCNPLVMDQWPASVVLCFAPGVLASEKRAALRYAVDNWQALLADMALPADGSIRHCWIEGFEFYCRPGNVKEAVIC